MGLATIFCLFVALTVGPHCCFSSPATALATAMLSDEVLVDDTLEIDREKRQSDECVDYLYILAFTSSLSYAGSDGGHSVELAVLRASGDTTTVSINLPDRAGNDYSKNKGDLWKLSMSSFGFGSGVCIFHDNITTIAIEEGSNDGWNIGSILTFTRANDAYKLATLDFDVNRWIDGNGEQAHRRFELTNVP